MYALSPREFERFVAYVLRRAGYDAREVGLHWLRGVDIEMRRPGRATIVGGVECKRLQPSDLVPARVVTHVKGAASVSRPGAKPYVITTSDFHENAHKIAEAGDKRAYLMNGQQLVRYITYIRGSRYDDDDTAALMSLEFFCGRETLHPPADGAAKILTLANNKGGVGKTTTAYYLGAAFAQQGKRVLLIDLDGQANLTAYCIPELDASISNDTVNFPSIAQYFAGQQPLQALVKSTSRERLCVIPSDPNLTLRDPGGSGRPDIESRFRRDVWRLGATPLASLGGIPDWIILDTAPAMTALTRAGLAAAQYVLAPMRPRKLSLPGTRNMLNTLRTVTALTHSQTTFLGVVITHWDNLKLSQNFEDLFLPSALQEFGGEAFKVKIPLDNRLEYLEPGAQIPGAKAYEALAIEVLNAAKWPIVHVGQ